MKDDAKKKLGKKAWSSRVTAPVLKLDLVVRCRNLPKKDLLSQADSFCVLWKVPDANAISAVDGVPSKTPGRQEVEVGRTEVSRACINPVFKHKFRLNFVFHKEQTYVLRVFDEDLRYATGLMEHDYLGGYVFSLGQLMGAKGCSLAKRLKSDGGGAYLVVTGEGVVETNRKILEFRFACQDLVQQHNIILDKLDPLKAVETIDKCRPYYMIDRLNVEDQKWETIWKSEVVKPTLDPVWNEARLPLQLLCNDDPTTPLKISIWDYEKHSITHDILGFVESSIEDILEKAKDGGIPVFIIMREKQKLFRKSKLKQVGLLKVLNAKINPIASVLQYIAGGMSIDLMVGVDCSLANEGASGSADKSSLHFESSMHFGKTTTLSNDYQAGIKKLGSITQNFSRGSRSSLWGLGAEIDGEYQECFAMKEKLCTSEELLRAYNDNVLYNPSFYYGDEVSLNPLIEAAIFRTIKQSKSQPCYTVLAIFVAGDVVDLQRTIDLICTAAEDAPISIIIIGVSNKELISMKKVRGDEGRKLQDSRGIPIAREIVTFVTCKQYGGDMDKVISEAMKEIPEQIVQYQLMNGIKPKPPVPPPDFDKVPKRLKSRRGLLAGNKMSRPKLQVTKGLSVYKKKGK